MKFFAATPILFLLSLNVFGNATDTISWIEGLLKEGKKVAILIIDMQNDVDRIWLPAEKNRVIPEETKVLEAFSGNKNVLFVDVNMEGDGVTIADLLHSIKKHTYRRLFVKKEPDAFLEASFSKGSQDENMIRGYLGDELDKRAVTDIVPMGCFSSRCVLETTQGAIRDGFNTHIDKDLFIIGDTVNPDNLSKEEMIAESEEAWSNLRGWTFQRNKVSQMQFIRAETDESQACAM